MGNWSGVWVLIGTAAVGLTIVFSFIILSEIFAKKSAPVIILGIITAASILMDYSSVRFGVLVLGGQELTIPCGVMMWPILFLAQDYLNEIYGEKYASYAIYAMMGGKIVVSIATLWILFGIPNPTDPYMSEVGKTWNNLMMISPRLNISSIIAAFCSSIANVWIFARLRILTKGRHLWLRNNVSSMSSLVIDSFVFNFGAFLFVLPVRQLVGVSFSSLITYWSTNLIDTGFIYLMRYMKVKGLFGIIPLREWEPMVIDTRKEIEF